MNRTMFWLLIGWTALSLSGCNDNPNQASTDPETVTQEEVATPADTDIPGSIAQATNDATGDGTQPTELVPPVVVTTRPVNLFSISSSPVSGELSILEAAKKGNVKAIRAALERGESASAGDDKMQVTPLMRAASSGCIDCMEVLLEAGAKIDSRNTASATALIMASMTGPIRSVKFLLDNGADPSLSTPSGRNALSVANERNDTDRNKAMIIILLEQALRQNPPA